MHAPKPHSGYIYLLRPTPELWTLSLPHRTQILYQTDISYIIQRLGVRPGTRVVEAGTGSGSMTHSLSRAVGPRGNVFSFEYHQNRFEAAKYVLTLVIGYNTDFRAEFESHNLANVRINHRNVCKDGFGEAENVQASEWRCCTVRAMRSCLVFLDLPAPWEAISDAIKAFDVSVQLRGGLRAHHQPTKIARICCFSPCLEQVLKTVTTLREQQFEG
jgi:tRNA (adenine57-N1/adenine58-N1)-methyltransferase